MSDEEKEQSAVPSEEELRKVITTFQDLVNELSQQSPNFMFSDADSRFFHDAAQSVADMTMVLIKDLKTRTLSDPVSVAEKMAIIDLLHAGNTLHTLEVYLNLSTKPWFGDFMDHLNVPESSETNASVDVNLMITTPAKKKRGRPRKKPKTNR